MQITDLQQMPSDKQTAARSSMGALNALLPPPLLLLLPPPPPLLLLPPPPPPPPPLLQLQLPMLLPPLLLRLDLLTHLHACSCKRNVTRVDTGTMYTSRVTCACS